MNLDNLKLTVEDEKGVYEGEEILGKDMQIYYLLAIISLIIFWSLI